MIPAPLACCAKICAASVTPGPIGEDTSDTWRFGLPGRLQEGLRLVEILDTLRDRMVVVGVVHGEQVVPDEAITTEDDLDHRLAVHDRPKGLPDSHVVEWCDVAAHRERRVVAAVRDDDGLALWRPAIDGAERESIASTCPEMSALI